MTARIRTSALGVVIGALTCMAGCLFCVDGSTTTSETRIDFETCDGLCGVRVVRGTADIVGGFHPAEHVLRLAAGTIVSLPDHILGEGPNTRFTMMARCDPGATLLLRRYSVPQGEIEVRETWSSVSLLDPIPSQRMIDVTPLIDTTVLQAVGGACEIDSVLRIVANSRCAARDRR